VVGRLRGTSEELHKELLMQEVRQVVHSDEKALVGILSVVGIPPGRHKKTHLGKELEQSGLHALPEDLIGGVLGWILEPERGEEVELPDQESADVGIIGSGGRTDGALNRARWLVVWATKERIKSRVRRIPSGERGCRQCGWQDEIGAHEDVGSLTVAAAKPIDVSGLDVALGGEVGFNAYRVGLAKECPNAERAIMRPIGVGGVWMSVGGHPCILLNGWLEGNEYARACAKGLYTAA